jgi:zeaxanthin glucosyltransferase
MKIGFITPCVPGHFNPMSALARKLRTRGHDVTIFSLLPVEPLARAADLPFVPFGEKEFPADESAELLGTLSRLKGEAALKYTVDLVAAVTEVKWKTLPKVLSSMGIEALVLDNYDFYGEILPQHLGLPYIVVSDALHFDYSGYTPLCVYNWAHESTPEAIKRNRQGVSRFAEMLIHSNAKVIGLAEQAGIKANWTDPSSLFSDLPWITQCPREFDFESSHWPQQFHYTGPFHDGAGRLETFFPWHKLTGEPFVYASMGTIQTGNPHIFRSISDAVSKHEDLQLVLSIGNVLRPEEIGPMPRNSIVVNHAPQLELLKRASVCVTHAGFNTVLEALTQGVPQIAIPVTNDQPGVAARIAEKKTGKIARLETLDASHLAKLLDEVLNNPVFRQNSRSIQKAIAQRDGLAMAADLVERAFGLAEQPEEPRQKAA